MVLYENECLKSLYWIENPQNQQVEDFENFSERIEM